MGILEIIGRLVLAVACSAVIGYERETAQKEAGFRTHMLVGVGACIFTIVSIIGFEGGDESRVAAQIVTGIGFLGAGAIFKEGATVKGLTTAAGLWAVAAVGMASGTGEVALAILGTVLVMAVLVGFHQIDQFVARRQKESPDRIEIAVDDTKRMQSLVKFAQRIDSSVEQLDFTRTDEHSGVLVISVTKGKAHMLAEMLSAHKGVSKAEPLSALYWDHPKPG